MRAAVVLAAVLGLGVASLLPNNASNRPARPQVGLDMCSLCDQFAGEAINTLLNLILQGGVVGTCGTLCSALADKTGSQALGEVCDLLCDIVGIEEFIKIIQKADLDPIYYCEELKMCAINDNGDAEITDLAIDPVSGPQGPKTISFTINSKNGTGTGELILVVQTVDGIPVEDGVLMPAQNATSFPVPQAFKLNAEPDPDCDPSQGPCEEWLPGNYQVRVEICNGQCGSNHPHTALYDRKFTNFTITG